jgi:hypothetical protein
MNTSGNLPPQGGNQQSAGGVPVTPGNPASGIPVTPPVGASTPAGNATLANAGQASYDDIPYRILCNGVK